MPSLIHDQRASPVDSESFGWKHSARNVRVQRVARSKVRCKDNDVALTHGDLVGNLDKELLPELRYFCGTVLVT